MAFEFTFTLRFQKSFKKLTDQEKKQLKKSWFFWQRIHPILLCAPSAFREPMTCLSAASTWISASYGSTKETK